MAGSRPRRKPAPYLPSARVTSMPPPDHLTWTKAATFQAIGLLLLVAGLVMLPVALWRLDPWACAACLAVYTATGGWYLATTDFGES